MDKKGKSPPTVPTLPSIYPDSFHDGPFVPEKEVCLGGRCTKRVKIISEGSCIDRKFQKTFRNWRWGKIHYNQIHPRSSGRLRRCWLICPQVVLIKKFRHAVACNQLRNCDEVCCLICQKGLFLAKRRILRAVQSSFRISLNSPHCRVCTAAVLIKKFRHSTAVSLEITVKAAA